MPDTAGISTTDRYEIRTRGEGWRTEDRVVKKGTFEAFGCPSPVDARWLLYVLNNTPQEVLDAALDACLA